MSVSNPFMDKELSFTNGIGTTGNAHAKKNDFEHLPHKIDILTQNVSATLA